MTLLVPPQPVACAARRPALRLYYVRVGFLASAYVNQVGAEPVRRLPRNLVVPFAEACALAAPATDPELRRICAV